MLEIVLICLFTLATLLFILSFFRKDKTDELEKQVDQMSITYMQEIYQLKSKIRLLEDELLISADQSTAIRQNHTNSHHKLLTEIIDLYEKGYDIQSISIKTKLSKDEVNGLLDSYQKSNSFTGM
ncbi:hypothetical protein [Halalkalibacter alkalisediminis]|uniref:Resolvase HTH domain-containing protein n=1 Tax=Halalkalibacter alkalisediminis TaxID=935616 RepID=A0ABV6NC84_9BACI|nr:hypothetical protein [Halalkalibacter alkalisediminis]